MRHRELTDQSPWDAEYFDYLPASLLMDFGGDGGSYPAEAIANATSAGSAKAAEAINAAMARYEALTKPWREAGTWGVGEYKNLLDPNSGVDRTEYLRETPGYQFQMDQGVNALDRSAASKGMLLSGPQAKAVTKYGQGLADTTFNNYLAKLSDLSGQGAGLSNSVGSAGVGAAGQLANVYTNEGQTNASNLINAYNARQSAYGNEMNNILGGVGLGAGILSKAIPWAVSTLSDKRTKKNIKNIDMEGGNALMVLDRMQPKTFDYKPEYGEPDQAGFVAQDLENVLPESVAMDQESGMRMVNPMAINALLVKAVQEQQGEINALKNAIGIQGRQEGGPIEQGNAYMVGEAGPEVIVPNQNAFVIPNQSNINAYEQALQEYPILQKLGIKGVYTNTPGKYGDIESWPAGETGSEDYKRPAELPMDTFGIQVFNGGKTKPIDVLADVASHYMIDQDPQMSKYYQSFKDSLTPEQKQRMIQDYEYAKANMGENRPYEDFLSMTRLPAYFRGYTFSQWPDDFNRQVFTPEQIKMFDKVRQYLGVNPQRRQ